MRLAFFLTGTLAAWGTTTTPAAGDSPADGPVRLEVKLDKTEYPFRGAIALTLTYTNTSKAPVALVTNGTSAGEGLPGETFEVASGAGRTAYTVVAVEPKAETITIGPGKSWSRTIRDLTPTLCNTGVTIDGRRPGGADRLPDPFGRLDEYTLRVSFQSPVKGQPKPAFDGKVESNAVKFKIALR